MGRVVRCGLTQVQAPDPSGKSLVEISEEMIELHMPLVEQAASDGVQIVCFQELYNGPYFCAAQDTRWSVASA